MWMIAKRDCTPSSCLWHGVVYQRTFKKKHETDMHTTSTDGTACINLNTP